MSIEIKLASLAETAKRVRHTLESEEATKTALVLPFLMALDYSVFDPTEVVPEYRADLKGTKYQERVDYAILRKGEPIILIEAKQANTSLGDKNQIKQLYRYWNETPAKVGILTNGIEYRFYGDTDQDNKMDATPFLIVDITKLSERDVASVSAFSKYNYDLEDTVKLSEELYYQSAIRKVMIGACRDPQTPFARWMMTRTYEGKKTASRVEWFKEQIKVALKDFCVANHQISPTPEGITTTTEQENSEDSRLVIASDDWTSLAEFEAVPGTKPPPVIRFPDGEEREVRYWNRFPVEIAEFLVRSGSLTNRECPVYGDLPGKAWVNFEPRHLDGNAFTRHEALSNGLFLFTNVSGSYAVYISRKLMENLGGDPAQVLLKTG